MRRSWSNEDETIQLKLKNAIIILKQKTEMHRVPRTGRGKLGESESSLWGLTEERIADVERAARDISNEVEGRCAKEESTLLVSSMGAASSISL